MTVTDVTDESKCCCSCKHNERHHHDNSPTTNYCDLDGHYIGYVACFESVCEEWEGE